MCVGLGVVVPRRWQKDAKLEEGKHRPPRHDTKKDA
jgi:hypothetical protein